MKRYKFLLFLPFIFLLAGCWDSNEKERMFYIHALGIDFVDGEYEVYMQIINFSNVAKSEQPTQNALQSNVNSAKGKTPDEGIFKLYNSIDEQVYWGHLTFVVFSEEALKQGKMNGVLNLLTRFVDTRYNVWLYCTDSSITDVLLLPTLLQRSITLTKLADPNNSFEQNSYIEPINIRRIILELNEPNYEAIVPFVTINKDWKSQKGDVQSAKFDGFSIIDKKTMKGVIRGDKARGHQWVAYRTNRSPVTVKIPEQENDYMTAVITGFNIKIEPIVKNDSVKFDIKIDTNAYLNSFSHSVKPEKVKEAIKKQIKEEILTTYNESLKMDADIYRLSESLYRKDVKAWKKLSSNGKVKLTEDSIRNIQITINKLGAGRRDFIDTLD